MIIENFKSNYYIFSKKVFLRPIMRKDVEGDWWKWLNNKKVTQLMDKGYKRNTKQKQLEYFKKIRDSNKDLLFAICLNNKKHIGCVGLHQINLGKRKAQFGIIIGNTRYHGRGIGKCVWSEIIKFGFKKLELKTISTMIVKENKASIKIAKSLGFKIKKIFKKFIKKKDKEYDYISYILKRNNWKDINLKYE